MLGERVFSPSRKTARFAPMQPVTVALMSGDIPMAYGIVSNISEGGTCIQTNVLPTRQSFQVTLSFYNGEYVQAIGNVVWSEMTGGAATAGVEFYELSDVARETLRAKLESTAFVAI